MLTLKHIPLFTPPWSIGYEGHLGYTSCLDYLGFGEVCFWEWISGVGRCYTSKLFVQIPLPSKLFVQIPSPSMLLFTFFVAMFLKVVWSLIRLSQLLKGWHLMFLSMFWRRKNKRPQIYFWPSVTFYIFWFLFVKLFYCNKIYIYKWNEPWIAHEIYLQLTTLHLFWIHTNLFLVIIFIIVKQNYVMRLTDLWYIQFLTFCFCFFSNIFSYMWYMRLTNSTLNQI